MSKVSEALALANEYAETGPDYNEAVAGGQGSRLLPEGYAFGRLCEYIELGKQPQEFNGKAKDPQLEAQFGFALWGEGYQNDDGTPYIIRPYSLALHRNDKATGYKLFKALNWKGTAKNFAQLLTEAYLVKIVHVPKSKADKTIVSRIDLTGFLPPLDPVSKRPYAIPELNDSDIRIFLWDKPRLSDWDELYVEGTWEDGKSKNRIQETILGAADFAGSALEQLLLTSSRSIPAKAPSAAVVASALPLPTQGITTLPAAPEVAPAAPLAPAPVATPSIPAVSTGAAIAIPPVIPALPSIPTFHSNAAQ